MRLVYLSPVPWDSFAQRPHKFVEWFHHKTHGSVLWIDPYPTRFPVIRDLYELGKKKDYLPRISHSWLSPIKITSTPIEPLPWSDLINQFFWKDCLKKIQKFSDNQPCILGIGKPSLFALRLMKEMHFYSSFYDAMDDFPAFFTGFSRLSAQHRENLIAQRVTHGFTSSSILLQRWQKIRKDIRLVNNGLDIATLPTQQVLISKKLSPSSHNVLGYVGTVGAWFDWDWLIALATMRPNDEIRLIGPVFYKPSKNIPENIKILPPIDHTSAILAMLDFNVGLIPFKKTRLTDAVDPIKYYEYRAMGLPVLSTEFGEMQYRKKEPGVFISNKFSNLFEIIQIALDYKDEKNFEFRTKNDWSKKFANISDYLNI